jgi:hypothetical protein
VRTSFGAVEQQSEELGIVLPPPVVKDTPSKDFGPSSTTQTAADSSDVATNLSVSSSRDVKPSFFNNRSSPSPVNPFTVGYAPVGQQGGGGGGKASKRPSSSTNGEVGAKFVTKKEFINGNDLAFHPYARSSSSPTSSVDSGTVSLQERLNTLLEPAFAARFADFKC